MEKRNIDKKLDTYCKEYRYDKIFLFPPYKEIYENDNERVESFEESKRLYQYFIDSYNHYNYSAIIVPLDNLENRIKFILNCLHSSS